MNGLRIFQIVFPMVMIASPLVFVLFFRPRLKTPTDDAAALAKVRKLTTALWAATLVSLIMFATAHVLLSSGPRASIAVSFTWMLFFPLWFGLAMPLLATKYPSMNTPYAEGAPTRSATLRRREVDLPISPIAWLLPWSMWLVGVVAVAASIAQAGNDVVLWAYLPPVIFQITTAVALALGPWCLRMLAREAEPLDAAGSAELAEGYRALRRFRVRGMFWLMFVGFAVISTSLACGTVWGISGPALGIAGGIVGTVVGLAGGVLGTIAGIRRARLTEMLQRLSADPANPPA